jgi:hypothetical protein
MSSNRVAHYALTAWLVTVSFLAFAQTIPSELPNAPTAGTTVPYQSVFTDYKNFKDPDPLPWREANQQVAESSEKGSHDMSKMGGQAKDGDMKSMPGHDMSKMKKESATPANMAKDGGAKETKSMEEMPGMKGMNHSDMKGMNNMSKEKAK